ncbi:MAG: hypothetical protein QOD02_2712 [Mycobacterium sp.]|nr:hypothetical protein [Mycobacterium sp.]
MTNPATRGGKDRRGHRPAEGAGGRWAGVSAAHKMASTSAISAAVSGSRCIISGSTVPMVSLVVGAAAAHPQVRRGRGALRWFAADQGGGSPAALRDERRLG